MKTFRRLIIISSFFFFLPTVFSQETSLGDTLFSFNAGVLTPTPDRVLFGVEYLDGYLWMTGADPDDLWQHKLYKFTADGQTLVETYEYGIEFAGWAGLAYDGEHLWTAGVDTIWQIDISNGQKTGVKIVAPQYYNKGLAYDPATDHFWVSGDANLIYEIDKQGNIINTVPFLPDQGMSGLAWDNVSEGGPYLWIWAMKYTPTDVRPKAYQMNVQTGTLTEVTFEGVLMNPQAPYAADGAAGATITDQLIDGKLTLIGVHGSSYETYNDQLDWVVAYDLDPEGSGVPGPEISITPESIQNEVMPGDTVEVPVYITNLDSSYNLNWFANLEYPGMNDTTGNPGDTLLTFDASALTSPEPNTRMRGLAFINDYIYVSTSVNFDDQFKIYKITKDGSEVVNTWTRYAFSYGWSAITSDGEYLYAGNQYTIDKVDPGTLTTVESYFKGSYFADALAYDPQQELFFLGNNNGAIKVINKDGDEVNFYITDYEIDGLSWDNWSPGGPYLWAYYKSGNAINAVRLNPNTGAPTGAQFEGVNLSQDPLQSDTPEDIFVTPDWQQNKLTMIGLHDSWNDSTTNADKVVVYDLATTPPPGWIKLIEPSFGTTAPLNSDTLMVRLMAIMEDTLMEAQVVVNSNDVLNPAVTIPVNFRMMPNIFTGLDNSDPKADQTGFIENMYPNPTSGTVNIQMSSGTENSTLRLYNTTGMLVRSINIPQGRSYMQLDVSGLPKGFYHLTISNGDGNDYRKLVIR